MIDVKKLAEQAGFNRFGGAKRDDGTESDYYDCWPEDLARFAALVRQEALEEVAKVAEARYGYQSDLAAAIRALAPKESAR